MGIRTRIGMTLVAVAIAGGLAFGFIDRPVPADVATVSRGPLLVTIEEEGRTRVAERYVVSAPVAGYLRRIGLHVGDRVRTGQVVAAIEPARASELDPRARAQAAAQVNVAQAALAAARENARGALAQADLARQELERLASLRQSGFISEQALDRARAEDRRAQAAKLAAEHAVSVARFEQDVARAALDAGAGAGRRVGVVEVRAPVDAQVLKLQHESEGAVQSGALLLEIGDPESLEVEVEVLSTQAVRIAPGAKVLFERWGGDLPLQGVVRVVEPAGFTKVSALGVEEQRVRVIVDFASPRESWRRLGDAYRVEARFVVWEGRDVLQVPASALFRQRDGWAVFVVDGGRARTKPVEVGQRSSLAVELRSGLAAGETLITHPDDRVRDGVRVSPRAPAAGR